jgi:hypothetical protein
MSVFADILNGNKSEVEKIKAYEKRKISSMPRNLSFAGIIGFAMIFFVLFSSQIISGVFALIVTVVSGAGGFYALRFLTKLDPLVQQKTKNLILKKMMEEAQNNAVSQLSNQVLVNRERLEKARIGRDKMGGLVKKLQSQVENTPPDKPIFKRKKEMLETVENAYSEIRSQLDKGAAANKAFEEKVEEFKDMNNFTDLVGEAMSIANSSKGDKMDQMLSLAAFEAIEMDFNTALIAIENQSNDMRLDNE